MDTEEKKPFKIKNTERNIKKAIVAGSLEEIRLKVGEKFGRPDQVPTIHLDSDGTEIDDEEYFRTLDANTDLIAVFPGEHWIDPSHYVAMASHLDQTDAANATLAAAAETARIQQLVGQLQNNLCNVSVMSDPDLDTLTNMDPNSLVDITGKDFTEQLKDSGRPLCAKRNAEDRINLLRLLKDGAIFCSERYPEDAEAIDMEIRRQLNDEQLHSVSPLNHNNNNKINNNKTKTIEQVQSATTKTFGNEQEQEQDQKQIEQQKQDQEQEHHVIVIDMTEATTPTALPSTTTTSAAKRANTSAATSNQVHDI